MATTAEAPVAPPPRTDERVARKSPLARFLARPEAGAIAGAIVIYVFFFIIAPPFRNASSFSSVLYVTSTYGLMATPVALLMIGGEFDLSAGVAVTSAALCGSLFAWWFTTNAWVGVLVALGFALLIGFINGWIVVKTGIPILPGHPGHVLHAPGDQRPRVTRLRRRYRAGQPGHLARLAGLRPPARCGLRRPRWTIGGARTSRPRSSAGSC